MSTLTPETLAALAPHADALSIGLAAVTSPAVADFLHAAANPTGTPEQRASRAAAIAADQPPTCDPDTDGAALRMALKVYGADHLHTPSPVGDGWDTVGTVGVVAMPLWDNAEDEGDPGTLVWEVRPFGCAPVNARTATDAARLIVDALRGA